MHLIPLISCEHLSQLWESFAAEGISFADEMLLCYHIAGLIMKEEEHSDGCACWDDPEGKLKLLHRSMDQKRLVEPE